MDFTLSLRPHRILLLVFPRQQSPHMHPSCVWRGESSVTPAVSARELMGPEVNPI